MVPGSSHIPILAVRSGQLVIYLQRPKLGRTGPRIPLSYRVPHCTQSAFRACEGLHYHPTGPPLLLQEGRSLSFNPGCGLAGLMGGGGRGYILLLYPLQDPLASMFLFSEVTHVVSQQSQQEAQRLHIQTGEKRLRSVCSPSHGTTLNILSRLRMFSPPLFPRAPAPYTS